MALLLGANSEHGIPKRFGDNKNPHDCDKTPQEKHSPRSHNVRILEVCIVIP